MYLIFLPPQFLHFCHVKKMLFTFALFHPFIHFTPLPRISVPLFYFFCFSSFTLSYYLLLPPTFLFFAFFIVLFFFFAPLIVLFSFSLPPLVLLFASFICLFSLLLLNSFFLYAPCLPG